MSEPVLLPGDEMSPVWLRLKAHWEKELGTLRAKLEQDLSELVTAKIRGRIAEMKENLALDKPAPKSP
jgi:hypothetical protein